MKESDIKYKYYKHDYNKGVSKPERPQKSVNVPEGVKLPPYMASIREAQEVTNLSYEFLRFLCYSGKVKSIKTGNKYMINYESLADFLNNSSIETE